MALLHDIQAALMDESARIGPILLKIKFLASRLGSDLLEDWVRYEAEGYPSNDVVPSYRKAGISYSGTFTNGHNQLNNISIPDYLIDKHCGEIWTTYAIVDALPVIEDMLSRKDKRDQFGINASNLKLLLDGKVYQGYTILELTAKLDTSAFVRITHSVRAKLLDLTIALEQQVPVAAEVSIGSQTKIDAADTQHVTQITQNYFNAPVQQISNSGAASTINTSLVNNDVEKLASALTSLGLKQEDGKELTCPPGVPSL